MNKPNRIMPISILVALLIPVNAYANAGTPLMWATMFHLVFGNAIIGLFEGMILSFWFKTSKWKTPLNLILANYVSAWAGSTLIVGYLSEIININIYNLHFWFWSLIAICFIITVLIEYPFFKYALTLVAKNNSEIFKATLVVNLLSYIFLITFYWYASGTSIITDLKVVPVKDLKIPENYELYYITMPGTNIVKSNIFGDTREVIKNIETFNKNDRLFVRNENENQYNLYLHLHSKNRSETKEELIISDFAEVAPVDWQVELESSQQSPGSWFNFGPIPKLTTNGDWEYRTGFWPVEGISGESKKENSEFYFSLETPFVSWVVRNAIYVENNFLVFQLGDSQICILDPITKQLALIAKGRGPIVAKSKLKNNIGKVE